jgi:AcrR family transcriptional regulator
MVHAHGGTQADDSDWLSLAPYILQMEKDGKVTRTFRRLDPQRQKAVIDAILEEATERGPAALNIKEVARRAGVSVGSLYQYFPRRDGLLDFAVELCTRYMVDFLEMSRPYLLTMPLREALVSYLTVGVEWGRTQTGLVRFFGRAAYQGDPDFAETVVRPIATAMRDLTWAMLAAARARGEIRPDVDLEAAARLVNTLTLAVADSQLLPYLNVYFQVTDEAIPPERVTAAFVDFVLDALTQSKGTAVARLLPSSE